MTRRSFLAFSLVACLGCAHSTAARPPESKTSPVSQATTLLFARHAEKADEGGGDPPLTRAGAQRAEALVTALGGRPVDAIYITPFRRTRATARPLAEARGLTVREHGDQDAAFAAHLLSTHRGETVLVVGHRPTIPVMLDALVGELRYVQAPPPAYGQLFVVTVPPDGPARVEEQHFGAASVPAPRIDLRDE